MDKTVTFISKSTFFQGNIFSKSIIVEGSVTGNVKATSSILIKESGRVEGNIQAPNIYFEKGSSHEGDIYLDDSEILSSAKENIDQRKSRSAPREKPKNKDNEKSKAQSAARRPKNKLW